MYKALDIEVNVLELETVIKACKYTGTKNLAFFFSQLSLLEEMIILLTFL